MGEPQFRVQIVKEKLFHTKEEAKAYYQANLVECDEMYGTDFGGRMSMVRALDDGTTEEIEMGGEEQCRRVNDIEFRVQWNELPANEE